jgi:hypothetical protein
MYPRTMEVLVFIRQEREPPHINDNDSLEIRGDLIIDFRFGLVGPNSISQMAVVGGRQAE